MKFTKAETTTVIFLAVLIVSLIIAIRIALHNPFLSGDEPYYHIRAAKALLDGNFEDKLVYGWRPFIFNPYHLVLALGILSAGPISALAISLAAGILSLILIQKLLLKINIKGTAKLVLMIFYITSPVFLYSLFGDQPSIVALLLQLAGFLLYISQKRKIALASLFFFSTAAFFGLFHLVTTLLILGAYSLYTKQKLHHFYLLIFIFSLIIILVYIPQSAKSPLLLNKPRFTGFVTDFGAETGFTVFIMALATLGFLKFWSKKKDPLLFACLFFVSATIIFETDLVYTNLILTFFAGLGFLYLLKSQWKLQLKTISITLIIIGLAFSAGSYAIKLAEKMPGNSLIDGLAWLKQNSQAGEFVLSGIENSFWIQTIAERPVLADKFSVRMKSSAESVKILESLFNSYDAEKTKKMLHDYNIRYIMTTSIMVRTNIDKSGLAYLLKNSKTFKKIYENDMLEIYFVGDYEPG